MALTYEDLALQQDLKILAAVRAILLTALLPDGTPVTPQTQLAAAAAAGATSVTVAEPRTFNPGGPFQWNDRTGEEDLYIDPDWDGDSNPVPLLFTGLPQPGLLYDHPPGARIGSNLFDSTPMHFENMLDGGDAVIYVDSDSESGVRANYSQNEVGIPVTLTVRLSMLQKRGSGHDTAMMDPNQWVKLIRRRARMILEACKLTIWQHWTLAQEDVPYTAIGIGDPNNPAATMFAKSWREVYVTKDNLQYQGRATFPVRGNWVSIDFEG